MIEAPIDVMEQERDGQFIWLVVSEIVPLVSSKDDKPRNVTRNIERWCAGGKLTQFARKASDEQIRQLYAQGRIKGPPQKDKGIYLVHRSGLAHIENRGRPKS